MVSCFLHLEGAEPMMALGKAFSTMSTIEVLDNSLHKGVLSLQCGCRDDGSQNETNESLGRST